LTRDLYVPPRSQCRNTLTTSSFFFYVRNEVSAPIRTCESVQICHSCCKRRLYWSLWRGFNPLKQVVRLTYTRNKQVVILLLLYHQLCLCLCLLCMWWHLGRS
jgi:hypothetical protein